MTTQTASTPIYRQLAQAFHDEGVRRLFALTGDGNMHWEASFSALDGVESIHVRHEHCAVAMATAYAALSGTVGVASVTCGPGVTQIVTALATAVEAHIPLVVFAGESPMHGRWYNQAIAQAPVVEASGARYIACHSSRQLMFDVSRAFVMARRERRPVVIGVPMDLQQEAVALPAYQPSGTLLPALSPILPHPQDVAEAAERIARASRIVVLAGRGAADAGAARAAMALADLVDGALSATLPVRGLFAGHARYVGLAGGFAHQATRALFAEADLVIAVGTSLSSHTSDGNTLFTPAEVIQIDLDPQPIKHGQRPAEMMVRADAQAALEAIAAALAGRDRPASGWSVADYARRLAEEPIDDEADIDEPGILDPRAVMRVLDETLPADWTCVNSAGHCSYYAAHLTRNHARDFLVIREFGVIGNGLSYALGAAAARPDRPVVLFEGDGGLMMHIQELETVRRSGAKVLLCIFNDGAYGSEIHKLRADGLSDAGAVYGRTDLGAIARGFGLDGERVTDLGQLPRLIERFEAGQQSMLLDIQISDKIMSPRMRKMTRR